jgi:hypothetical protein
MAYGLWSRKSSPILMMLDFGILVLLTAYAMGRAGAVVELAEDLTFLRQVSVLPRMNWTTTLSRELPRSISEVNSFIFKRARSFGTRSRD